jgi:hypothetical protein
MAHDQEIVGSNHGTVYWMDVSNASYYIQEKMKNKGSQMGHTKKIFKTYISILKLNLYVKSGQPFHNKKEDLCSTSKLKGWRIC